MTWILLSISFKNPWFLLLLLLVPFLLFWSYYRYQQQFADLKVSSLDGIKNAQSFKSRLRPLLNLMKVLAFTSLVLAMARPQDTLTEEKIKAEGIDIVLVQDISGSMLAQDFQPDRLGASKIVADTFIVNRPADRIGLVVFAGESFTQCPITTDKGVARKLLSEVKSFMVNDGTAIGMGLATAVNRLKDTDSDSKVIILLTDGVNMGGFIDPMTAAETAKQFDIKVYTIGVGTRGKAYAPVGTDRFGRYRYDYVDVNIDEKLMQDIADLTGGKYFRATDNQTLFKIYDEIDVLEKTEIEVTTVKRYTERFYPLAWLSFFLIVGEILLRNTIFRGLP